LFSLRPEKPDPEEQLMTIPCEINSLLGSIAEAEAAGLGVPMAIALADHSGNLQFFTRMDRTLPASSEIAISKAYTAAALRMPTGELGKLAMPGGPLYGIEHTHNGKIILFGGGLPLCMDGRVLGGIGISGGTVEEDECVANAVVRSFDEMVVLAAKVRALLPMGRHYEALSALDNNLREAVQSVRLPYELSTLLTGSIILALQDHNRH